MLSRNWKNHAVSRGPLPNRGATNMNSLRQFYNMNLMSQLLASPQCGSMKQVDFSNDHRRFLELVYFLSSNRLDRIVFPSYKQVDPSFGQWAFEHAYIICAHALEKWMKQKLRHQKYMRTRYLSRTTWILQRKSRAMPRTH